MTEKERSRAKFATRRYAQSHENFLHAVRDTAAARPGLSPDHRDALLRTKLVYGIGRAGTRGVCHHDAWRNGSVEPLVEIAAITEESPTQLAGTTLHELAHVLAGFAAGHRRDWVLACRLLGLRFARATGQHYQLADFAPDIRFALALDIRPPTDGNPVLAARVTTVRPCSLGIGTRGGRSRGPGSGSRLIKVACPTCGYIARVTRLWLDTAGAPICPTCRSAFTQA